MKQKSRSYLNYVFKNVMLLSGIFILLLCIVLYLSYLNFTRSTYLQSLSHNSRQSAELIDNCIEQSNNLSYLIAKDNSIKNYVYSDGDDQSQKIAAMQFLQTGWLFHGDIAAILPEKNLVIKKSDAMSVDFYINDIGLSAADFDTATNALLSGEKTSPYVMFPSHDSKQMVVIHHLNISDKPLFVFSVFDLSMILPKANQNGNFCIRRGDELIYSVGPIGYEDAQAALTKGSSKYKVLSDTAEPISFFNRNECFYIVPNFDYMKQSHNFALTLFLIVLFSAMMVYFFTSIISNKIYAPIQKLVDSLKDKNDSDTNNELEYISNKITTLSDKNKTLFDLVGSHAKQLSDIFFIKLLSSPLLPDEVERGIKEFNYSDYRLPVCAFVAKITNYETFNSVLDVSGIHILQNDILNMFLSDFGESELKILNIENDKFAGIIAADNLLSQKRRLILCASKIETSLEARLRICVGDAVSSWNDIASSYNSAVNILDNFYFRPSSASVILSGEISTEDAHIYYPANLDNSLLQAIVHGQKEEIKNIVCEIIDNNYKIEMLKTGLHSQLVMMLVSSLTKVFMTLNKSPEELLSQEENIYATLIQHTDPEKLKEAFLKIAYKISDYTDSLSDSINQKIAQNMLSYIYENYSQVDISLSSLAAHINLSQSHTSRLFKQLIGENFKDYLAKYRISMAKNILDKNPSVKMKDLANAVGYSSSDILNKVFMRYEGYLPSEYKKY